MLGTNMAVKDSQSDTMNPPISASASAMKTGLLRKPSNVTNFVHRRSTIAAYI